MPNTNAADNMIAYCVKCKSKVGVVSPEKVVFRNSRHALKGKCPHCGTNVYKITGTPEKK